MKNGKSLFIGAQTGLLICILLLALPCSAKTTKHHPAKRQASSHEAAASCSSKKFAPISKAEFRKHIKAVAPLDAPCCGKKLDGVVTLRVAISETGRVACVAVVRGQKDAAEAITKSVRDWRFSPYKTSGKARAAAGELSIKYHLRDQGSTAGVE